MGGKKNISSYGSVSNELITSRTSTKLRAPTVYGSRMNCVRKAKNAAKNPMADCVPSYIGTLGVSNVKQKAAIKKTTATVDTLRVSSPRAHDVCNVLTSTVVNLNERNTFGKNVTCRRKDFTKRYFTS